jgi:hypothetical protein
VTDHADEGGQPCTRHVASREKLLDYALVGARAPGFHHDAASKLQSMMMALDEISELIGDDPSELRTATETAQTALRELNALLSANRTLAKAPQQRTMGLRDLLEAAARRSGVKLGGELTSPNVMVAPPAIIHALAILIDLVAGSVQIGRSVEATIAAGERVTVTLTGTAEPTHANANELIAIAARAIARDQGVLTCGPKSFVVELQAG